MKNLFVSAFAAVCAACSFASFGPLSPGAVPSEKEYIWPEGRIPDFQPQQVAAKYAETLAPDFKADANRRPYIEWYAPDPAKKTDLCVLFVSGGGFGTCCDAARLQPAIDRFVREGVTVVNLTYRTPRPEGLPIYQSGWEDAQRAVRVIRSQAAKRGFGPDKIGATGISAGSKLVLLLATSSETPAYKPVDEIDALPCNLLFAIPQAPAYVLSDGATTPNAQAGDGVDVRILPEFRFDAKTCPMCLFQGGADEYSPNGSTQLYRQLRRMGIPAEIHLYADRTHGFHGDLNKTEDATGADRWFGRALEFVRQMNYDGRLGAEVDIGTRYPDDSARGGYVKEALWPEGRVPDVQTNQCDAYIEWHLPKDLRTQAIQIMFSGGCYIWNDPSCYDMLAARRYLNKKGMTVVALRYRMPRPLGGLAKHTTAWQDLQRAVRKVRFEAWSRGLDPNRIGVMGASAGGHLAVLGATGSRHRTYLPVDAVDQVPCDVQWAVSLCTAYALTDGVDDPNTGKGNDDAARLVPEFPFDLSSCPMLFLHGDADEWAAMNSVKCWEQLRRMGLQGEIHTLALRKHDFVKKSAPGTGSYTWLDRIWEFMNHKGYNK